MTGAAETPDPASGKEAPEALELRARPRPVTRVNRKVLIAGAALGAGVILALTLLALEPRRMAPGRPATDPVERVRAPTAEGLDSLPRSYGEVVPAPPALGPPLAGDVGPAVVDMERELGLADPGSDLFTGPGLRPDPEADQARAARLRRARQAQQAREAGVFFQTTVRPAAGQSSAGGTPAVSEGDAATTVPATSGGAPVSGGDPGGQARKAAFLDAPADPETVNPHPLRDPVSPYQLLAGTVIPASLVTGINSDLPGLVIAQVTENVFDTVTGRHLLIPQGARLIGRYDSVVAFGQRRALVVWHRLIMPDGSSILLESLPATDTAGFAGLADAVDFHTGRLATGVALSTLLGVGTELTLGDDESELVEAIRESAQESVSRAGRRLTERNLDIPPTITIRPGWPLRVIVHKDLILRPYES